MTTMLRTRLALVALALALPACGGGGGGGGGAPPAPLAVVQRVPGADATGVVRTANLYVRLSRAAAPGTVNTANVILALGGAPVPRAVSFDANTLLLTINPDAALSASTAYTVTLTAGLTDTVGVAVTPETYTITTSGNADATPPAFAGAFTVSARTTTSIDLQWPTATDASAIEYELFSLAPGAAFDPTLAPSSTLSGTTVGLSPLSSDTGYQYRVRARDAAGNLSDMTLALTTKTLTSFTQDVWTGIINNNQRCTHCHKPMGDPPVPPFTMETAPVAYGNLVNVDAVCNIGPGVLPVGTKRVLPSNGAASFLYQKVAGTPICGVRMPHDGATTGYLQDEQVQTIKDWIDEGALDN